MNKKLIGAAAVLAFVGSVVFANYLTARFGFVGVGFGQVATATAEGWMKNSWEAA